MVHVARVDDGPIGVAKRPRDKDADTKAFEKDLADLLGLQVEIKRGSGESGALTIRFGNFDQLDSSASASPDRRSLVR